jgi:LSD1 subclass zinc finger protein
MVCGSCRRLLSYLRGSKHVKCSSCQTVNLVLEANQVGQVNCNNCKLLLMYPYGAPAVRCSSCNSVTDISVCIHRWFCAPCPNHTWKS